MAPIAGVRDGGLDVCSRGRRLHDSRVPFHQCQRFDVSPRVGTSRFIRFRGMVMMALAPSKEISTILWPHRSSSSILDTSDTEILLAKIVKGPFLPDVGWLHRLRLRATSVAAMRKRMPLHASASTAPQSQSETCKPLLSSRGHAAFYPLTTRPVREHIPSPKICDTTSDVPSQYRRSVIAMSIPAQPCQSIKLCIAVLPHAEPFDCYSRDVMRAGGTIDGGMPITTATGKSFPPHA